MPFRNITIVGGGAMGTALAVNLAKKLEVRFVVRSRAAEIAKSRENPRYLPGRRLPDNVTVVDDLELAEEGPVLLAIPTSAFESVLEAVAPHLGARPLLWACKGFAPGSGELLSETAARRLGPEACYGVLSGPSFAEGLVTNDPTAVVVATNAGPKTTLEIAEGLSNASLRVYANSDLAGVQICGAIKNVYAIASGVIDGCGWGENTRAAMVTRAIAEVKRFLDRHACDPATLLGLSGFGDIYLTCGSRLSRNYQVGLALAGGKSLDEALAALGHVAEGVHTARLIRQRAAALGVEMPISNAVNDVLEGRKTPQECAATLMGREIKQEQSPSAPNP